MQQVQWGLGSPPRSSLVPARSAPAPPVQWKNEGRLPTGSQGAQTHARVPLGRACF